MSPAGFPDPLSDPTPLQAAVIAVVADTSAGQMLTYAEIAQEAGHPGSSQAVSNVLRRVPDLPWWRVIPSTSRLYRTHQPIQRNLLRAEGVEVDLTGQVSQPRHVVSVAFGSVDGLADQVGVARVAGVLLDEVDEDPSEVDALVVARPVSGQLVE